MPRLLQTASFRLAILYLMLFTISAVVLGTVVFWTTNAALQQQLRSRVQAEAASLSADYRVNGLARLLADVDARGRGSAALDYLVQDAEGRHLGGEISTQAGGLGWLHLVARETDDARQGERSESLQAFAVPLGNGIVLAVGDDTAHIAEAEEAVLRAFAWAVGLTLLLGGSGGVWLSHMFLRRVDAIGRTAEAIIGGDLSRRIQVKGTGDDLDRLAMTLNQMLDRIVGLMENLRQVSTDIAHDLRTPLSRLCQKLDAVRTGTRSIGEYEAAVDGAMIEAESLLGTFAALLRIAQVEAGAQRTAFGCLHLSALAESVADTFAPVAEDEGRSLSAEIIPGVTVSGDQELLTQMLVNLVENAIRHTSQGSHIRISLDVQVYGDKPASGPTLTVEDNGPGIPEAERGRVLRRFYRLEQSRTTPGSGLGLSLVSAIADLHDCTLVLADAQPGLRVSVRFPDF